jgi:predicted ATPase
LIGTGAHARSDPLGGGVPAFAPDLYRLDDPDQIAALVRQLILDPRRERIPNLADQDALLFEELDAAAQRHGVEITDRVLQRAEPDSATRQSLAFGSDDFIMERAPG